MTELDRLIELIIIQHHRELTDLERDEWKFLKSQIESKLAQADNPSVCPICQGRGFVPEGFYSTTTGQWSSTSTLTEKCRSCNGLGIIQNSNQELPQLRDNHLKLAEKYTKLESENAQLRPIVQKIQEAVSEQLYSCDECGNTFYRKIKSILESK